MSIKDVLFELKCSNCDGALSLNGKKVENMVAEVQCEFCDTNFLYIPDTENKVGLGISTPMTVGGIVAGTINAKNIVHGNMTVYGDYVGGDKQTIIY